MEVENRLARIEERLDHIADDVAWLREHVIGFAETEGRLRAIGALGGWLAGVCGGITVGVVVYALRLLL